MRFTCSKSAFADGINKIYKTSQMSGIPAFKGIKIDVEGETLRLTAICFNEFGIEYAIQIPEAEENGQILVYGKYLANILKHLPAGNLNISSDDKLLTVGYHQANIRIPLLDQTDFPPIPESAGDHIIVSTKDLINSLKRTYIIAGIPFRQDNPVFWGVYIVFEDNELEIIATDTHRIAISKCPVSQGGMDFTANISAEGVRELLKVLTPKDKSIEIFPGEGNVIFRTRTAKACFSKIIGAYPDYRRVMPRGLENKIRINTAQIRKTLQRVKLFTSHTSDAVKLSGSNVLTINTPMMAIGQITEDIETLEHSGNGLLSYVKLKYLSDAVSTFDGEANISYGDNPLMPLLFEAEGYEHLVLPVRVSDRDAY